ncbi:Acylphosphatase-2 [Schistosoma japonicum]|uniref:acylphosphatase n=1 Tax=Schistosoma japonicum TaxID=6182 RepID=Q5DFQ8_SCHJA|nr:SJCHGC02749 protein [Schistosoma japonicum]KAH8852120.1 Acylphosphatase-2 [Schistosoma japonicum]KAH8852121.1 Acylphosphatase-2 [Schistosoma japonicum]TNN08645.1 Acylphosphatase-2 [Schistosoma japonicum]CAX69869.1 acylphosphatase 2, muscle type [Schistosoma japonicum]
MAANQGDLKGCSFEVYGRVQGVCFRKYASHFAKANGIVGWIKNTENGTVTGECEGSSVGVDAFKHWLCNVGSPNSHIDKCQFKNERKISQLHFKGFNIRH